MKRLGHKITGGVMVVPMLERQSRYHEGTTKRDCLSSIKIGSPDKGMKPVWLLPTILSL